MASPQRKFRHRILIVDDEESVRSTLTALLADGNYEIQEAAHGFEALAIMRGAIPDLLICDLKMPNMSGFELLGVVRKRFPSVAVIVMSGEFQPISVPPDLLADRYLEKGHTPPFGSVRSNSRAAGGLTNTFSTCQSRTGSRLASSLANTVFGAYVS